MRLPTLCQAEIENHIFWPWRPVCVLTIPRRHASICEAHVQDGKDSRDGREAQAPLRYHSQGDLVPEARRLGASYLAKPVVCDLLLPVTQMVPDGHDINGLVPKLL